MTAFFISTKLAALLLLFAVFVQGLGDSCGTGQEPDSPKECGTMYCPDGQICRTEGKVKQYAFHCQVIKKHKCKSISM